MIRTLPPIKAIKEKEEIQFGIPDIGIPAEVLFNPKLTETEKMLFGFLRNLSQTKDGCWASNKYLGKLLYKKGWTISQAITNLTNNEYITTRYEQKQNGIQIRRIYINPRYPIIYRKAVEEWYNTFSIPLLKNHKTPIDKSQDPYCFFTSKDVKEDVKEERLYRTTVFSWKELLQKYGSTQVQFTKWFLKEQQKNYPKLITGVITPNHPRVLSSLDTIEKLCRIDGYDFEEEVKPILEQVPNHTFWSRQVLSFSKLRTLARNGETKFTNICASIEKGVPKKGGESPQTILIKEFNSAKIIYDCFQPLLNALPTEEDNNGVERKLAQNIIALASWYVQKQKKPTDEELKKYHLSNQLFEQGIFARWVNVIPTASALLTRYVSWLQDQLWITTYSADMIKPEHKIFKQFLDLEQKRLDVNFFTGKDITK